MKRSEPIRERVNRLLADFGPLPESTRRLVVELCQTRDGWSDRALRQFISQTVGVAPEKSAK